jgi:cell division protein FtsZ
METSIDGARGVLVNITGSMDIGLEEVETAASLVQQAAHPEANIIFGAAFDDTMDDEIRVTVIATGFEDKKAQKEVKKPGIFTGGVITPSTEEDSSKQDDDPFGDIFKIFNSK